MFKKNACPTIDATMYNEMLACVISQVSARPGESSVFTLRSGPGVGKNGMHRSFAEWNNLYYVEYMCSGTPSADITGFCIPDKEKGIVEFMPTLKFISHEVPEGYDGVYMHIQELDKLSPDQQAIVGVILDTRMLEGIPVQENLFYCASMNSASDNCGGEDLTRQMEDRLYIHDLAGPDPEKWLVWAAANEVHPYITGFIGWSKKYLYDFNPDQSGAFCSPRSWVKASRLITSLGDDVSLDMMQTIIEHKCGPAPSLEFAGYIRLASELVPVSEVLRDPHNAPIPHHDLGAQYAMCSLLATEFGRMHKKGDPLLRDEVEAAITYIRRMDEGHAVYAFRMMTAAHPDFSSVSQEYTKFIQDYKGITF